jgi:hypothetical protein
VGIGLLGSGTAAVFQGKDGAGSLALVAVGALFLLVGLTGAIPTNLKVGSNEMLLQREILNEWAHAKPIVEQVEQAREAVALGRTDEAERRLQRLATPDKEIVDQVKRIRATQNQDQEVLALLNEALPPEFKLMPLNDKELLNYIYIGDNQVPIHIIESFDPEDVRTSLLVQRGLSPHDADLIVILQPTDEFNFTEWQQQFDWLVRVVPRAPHDPGRFQSEASVAVQSIIDQLRHTGSRVGT